MDEVIGRIAKYSNDRGMDYAEVAVTVDARASGIDLCCAGEGWQGQGGREDASAVGYDLWKKGAVAGIEHALRVAGRAHCHVRISGMSSDTNPACVAAAAVDAVWRALGYVPTQAERDRVT